MLFCEFFIFCFLLHQRGDDIYDAAECHKAVDELFDVLWVDFIAGELAAERAQCEADDAECEAVEDVLGEEACGGFRYYRDRAQGR